MNAEQLKAMAVRELAYDAELEARGFGAQALTLRSRKSVADLAKAVLALLNQCER